MILLKYNGQEDVSFGEHTELKIGDVVALIEVITYETIVATVWYMLSTNTLYEGSKAQRSAGNLNCFDFIPKKEHYKYVR